MFLVLEGVEGSGKSTQVRLLGEWLGDLKVPHIITREPGGTQVGEEIRRALLHRGDMPARTELLLMLAARAAFVDEIVKPALERGEVVIADRYELSSFAYQAYGRGIPIEEVRRLNTFATGGLTPDLTILLDVTPQEGAARRITGGSAADRIERAGEDFHREVGRAYRLLSGTEPGIAVVPGTGEREAVQQQIRAVLRGRFPETFPSGPG